MKLARMDGQSLGDRAERVWPTVPDAADIDWLQQQRTSSSEEVLLSTSRPAALPLLQEAWGDALKLVEPAAIPLERTTTGTGSDRLLAGLAAVRLASCACLVVDLGTAWTLDVIDATPCFRGGVIGPGLGMQAAALADACPHLDAPGEPTGVIPTSTAAAVRAGIFEALAVSIESLASRYASELGGCPARFITGGDAAQLAPLLSSDWQRVDDLVLHGLAVMAAES
ncbi:MAG: type III pantothenate kinase [Planctomycetes bacterium]|nr:type III pantothenate kinase [Planctomycetota bacterium]